MSILRRPQTLGGVVYLAVVVATLVGLAVVLWGPWRRGVVVIGCALLVAAAVRLVLNEGQAGMLRVRSRWFDLAFLTGAGAALLFLAGNIPDQIR